MAPLLWLARQRAGIRGPLPQKLGIKHGHRIVLLGAPEGFDRTLGTLPPGVEPKRALDGTHLLDVVLLFVTKQADFDKKFAAVPKRLDPAGALGSLGQRRPPAS